jgi:hypothetical protein
VIIAIFCKSCSQSQAVDLLAPSGSDGTSAQPESSFHAWIVEHATCLADDSLQIARQGEANRDFVQSIIFTPAEDVMLNIWPVRDNCGAEQVLR